MSSVELSKPAVTTPWLSDLQNRSKEWGQRRADAVLGRLDDERARLQRERAQREREIANVEQQISLLQKSRRVGGAEESDNGNGAGAATPDKKCSPTFRPCSSVCESHFLWLFSGIINGVLKLIFCIVYGALIVDAAPHLLQNKLPILIGTQLAAAFVTNLFTARYSSVGSSISGPDIVHALVMKTMTTTVARVTDDPEVALSTVLFLMCSTSFVISVTWLFVARFRLSVMIDFFPISVVTGFLGCIGYKVLKEAIHIAVGNYWYDPSSIGFWRLLVPALPIGIPLYILKRFHIGDPKISMLFYIMAPPVVFFIAQAGSGKSLAQTRSDGWLPDESAQGAFYAQWTHLQWSKISGEAVLATLPETIVLAVMVTLDAFLYLKMTKRELQTKMDMENEFYVISFQNMLSTLFVGPVGYSQVKFNKINFAITKDAHDRRPTILIALLCGFFWFTGIPFINILPRFFLGGLLIYAGMFFLELVIVSYQRVTKKEYCIVWLIILINAFTGLPQVTGSLVAPHSLLIAVISGLILAAVGFIYQYARVSVIRDVLSGQDFQSAVVRPFSEQSLVERIGTRYMIIELEGYIFFGSATQVVSMAKFLAEQNVKTPEEGGRPMAESLKYVAIDFAHVENIDYSGAGAFREVREILEDAGCAVLFTSLNSKVRKKLIQEDVIQLPVYGPGKANTTEGEPCLEFADLDFASEYVEGCLLERAAFVRGYWLLFDSFQKLHTQAVLKANFEIFEAILGTEAGNRLWRYAEKIKFKAGEFLCREGHFNHTLYLLQKGKVTTFVATGGGHLQLQRQAISITVASKNRGALNESDWGLKSKSVSSSGNSDGVESNVKRTGKGMVKTKREISRERSMSHLHSHIKRKHTMGRGAFVNEECLFRDTPVQNSTVADEDCTVWAISRQSMKELEAHDSNLAAAILRNILRVSSAVRERLEREVFAIESYHTTTEDEAVPLLRADTAGSMQNPQQPSSKNLGNRVLKEIRDMHEHHVNDVSDVNLIDDTLHVTGAGSHHLHHFHHMTLDNALHVSGPDIVDEIRNQPPMSPVASSLRASAASTKSRKNGESSLDWHSVRPHLSAAQRQDAIDCFLVHSVLEQNDISGASSGAHPDILPELILAGVAPHVVHAVATKVNNDKAERQDAAEGKSASETPEIRRKKRRGTIDALHELRRPKSLRVVELNSELDAGEVEASEVSLLESIMRAHTNGRSPNMAHRSGDAKAIAEKFARMTSSPVGTPSTTPTSPKRPGSPALRHDLKLGSVHRRLSLEELQRAVMDLGFFPSAAEVRQMHETLGPQHEIRVDSNEFDAGVDLDEFLEMITVLSLKRMTERELHGLHVLFLQHADVENERQDGMQLSREALGKLMKSLNHPEDEVELEFLMREWDLEGRGFLDFDAFVSIVSHVLKSEELDEHIERDFLTLCGETDIKHPSMSQQRCAVVAGDIVRRARELGVVVDHRLAEEMVFDADEDRTGKVSLDELIVTLETVHIDESIDEKYANANTGVAEGGWLGS